MIGTGKREKVIDETNKTLLVGRHVKVKRVQRMEREMMSKDESELISR